MYTDLTAIKRLQRNRSNDIDRWQAERIKTIRMAELKGEEKERS